MGKVTLIIKIDAYIPDDLNYFQRKKFMENEIQSAVRCTPSVIRCTTGITNYAQTPAGSSVVVTKKIKKHGR